MANENTIDITLSKHEWPIKARTLVFLVLNCVDPKKHYVYQDGTLYERKRKKSR